jgi:SAM-dependent methyltransferase
MATKGASVLQALRTFVVQLAPERFYPQPASGLQPERLYLYLDALWKRREVPGEVLEVGCWRGGTAAIASSMLRRTGFRKRYRCIDTFGGFVSDQFDADVKHGTPEAFRGYFANSSLPLVRRLLDHYGCKDVDLFQGDITRVPEHALPDEIAVCLLDVDLEVPIHRGLERLYPRLAKGGIILVDDCPESTSWVGARIGYKNFVRAHGLAEEYAMGMGILTR